MLRPQVFFDIAVYGRSAGRVVMELFTDAIPTRAESFRALCGDALRRGDFQGGRVCRAANGSFIVRQSGGAGSQNASAGAEEGPVVSIVPGASEYLVCTARNEWLDGRAFVGRIVAGKEVFDHINQHILADNKRAPPAVVVAASGQLADSALQASFPKRNLRFASPDLLHS